MIEITVNGAPHRFEPAPGETLLQALRGRAGVCSTKDGCSPQGQCGCCLALIDGAPKVTCAQTATRADGKSVVTLEGLPEREREQIARAFVVAGGMQCGFCIPSIALRAHHLLERRPDPTRAEIARAIDGHLCRCTGYTKVIDAIELLAECRRTGELPPLPTDGGVGDPLGRVDGPRTALGDRPYVADMTRDGMLHGALTLSAHARARVLAIDPSAALAMPGVHAVITAADVPGKRWYGLLHDDWPGFVAVGEEVRCCGDVLAAVVAVDRRTARAAAAAVVVRYEPLEPVLDPEVSIAPGAPQVNPHHPNVLGRSVLRRGDVDAALAASAHVVRESFRTQRIEHLYLEPEAALAEPLPEGRLALFTQGQGVFDDRRQVAGFLGVDETDVDVELVPNGGAFGGKEDMSVQAQTALLAVVTGRPVLTELSREESVRLHPKRHPLSMDFTVGCDAEGRLTAVRARLIGDSGAYASVGAKVLERAAGHACGPYRVPNVELEAIAAYTNHPPSGAMRGFGANQASFAIEGCLDRLAERIGLDGWEMRWRNALAVGDTLATGQVLRKSVGVRATLQAVRPTWEALRAEGRAVGIACGIKNSGIGNGVPEWGRCRLVVDGPDAVRLYNGYTEMGQGLLTVLVQFAVEVTGLPAAVFDPRVDSTFALGCGQTTGSRGTLLSGRAVIAAAEKLRADLDAGAGLVDLVGRVYAGDVLIDDTTALGADVAEVKTHTTFGYATQLCVLDAAGRVERMVAAHDVGRVVNPVLCSGQVEGAVHMGLGFALTEEVPCVDGFPVTSKLRDIGVLRARDMPEVEVILVEEHEPEGPFGAKGVGEIGLVPTAGAVAAALHAHDGVWRTVLPMKDSAAAKAITVGRIRGDRSTWR